jgi:hypothetical protein
MLSVMMRLADHHTYTGPVEPRGQWGNVFTHQILAGFWPEFGKIWQKLGRLIKV